MSENEFDMVKSRIKIYKEEYEEKGKDILQRLNKLGSINTIEDVIEYRIYAEKVGEAIILLKKIIDAQDKYIKELEKIIERAR